MVPETMKLVRMNLHAVLRPEQAHDRCIGVADQGDAEIGGRKRVSS